MCPDPHNPPTSPPLPHSADEVLLKPSGAQLTVEYLEEKSFSVPILVARKEGLGMTLPPPTFGPRDVEHYVGELGGGGRGFFWGGGVGLTPNLALICPKWPQNNALRLFGGGLGA